MLQLNIMIIQTMKDCLVDFFGIRSCIPPDGFIITVQWSFWIFFFTLGCIEDWDFKYFGRSKLLSL